MGTQTRRDVQLSPALLRALCSGGTLLTALVLLVAPVALHAVEDGVVRRIAYDRNRFTFGKLKAPDEGRDLGFSGFRLLQ